MPAGPNSSILFILNGLTEPLLSPSCVSSVRPVGRQADSGTILSTLSSKFSTVARKGSLDWPNKSRANTRPVDSVLITYLMSASYVRTQKPSIGLAPVHFLEDVICAVKGCGSSCALHLRYCAPKPAGSGARNGCHLQKRSDFCLSENPLDR